MMLKFRIFSCDTAISSPILILHIPCGVSVFYRCFAQFAQIKISKKSDALYQALGDTYRFAWAAQPAAMRSRARCGYYAFGKIFSTRQNASFCVDGAAGRHAEQGTLRVLCLWQNVLNTAKRIVLRGRHSRPPCGAGHVEGIMPLAKYSQRGKTHRFAWTAQPAAMRSRARRGYYAFGKMFSTWQNASFCVDGTAGRHAEQDTLRLL
ncbi:hypothetical protein [Yeguia hominis]|uniref:Uncharacterized protein n=1 Tax=Yeguia hominis TaxID=2763662 RepID=A0A926DBL5_9FIRM|nr:hypothetical protein [Yeguia hominis]MBC8534359.1 hypothetical protein [Yeguia hominis]